PPDEYLTFDNMIITGTYYPETPPSNFNFYDADPEAGPATLLAGGATSYDPMTTPGTIEHFWVTTTDGTCESEAVMVTVDVADYPGITCPDPFSVDISNNGTGDCSAVASWNHPVEENDACEPQTLTMSIDGGPPVEVIQGGSITETLDGIGAHTVHYIITDGNDNTDECTLVITVVDDEAPILACATAVTVDFNGEDYLLMEDYVAQLVDLANTYDICCQEAVTFTFDPPYITCDQLGEVIDITVTATDCADNSIDCTVAVTVDGLPCGWMTWDDHVGCEGSSADYDVPSETFFVTSADCNHSPYSPFNEEYAYVKTVLCGDGEIIAHVANLDGLGKAWAGIVMRESNDPGSKKFQVMTGLDYLQHRVDWRSSTGGFNQTQNFSRYGQHWLRIVRNGPIFQAYTSYNGTTWGPAANTQVIQMDECLEVGLVVTNVPYATNVTASFDHVQTTPPYVPSLPGGMRPDEADTPAAPALSLEVYPNPTSGQLTLNLGAFLDREATLEVMDINGQLILQRRLGVVEHSTERLDLSPYTAGMYFVRLRTGDGTTAVQRVVLQPRP
ncbi:MAG: T9SS type A sorting domain-containing protein, partial [Lewinella sp.]|nr:T9SS type A sorting domain-containing protein [Lewinella sp.]